MWIIFVYAVFLRKKGSCCLGIKLDNNGGEGLGDSGLGLADTQCSRGGSEGGVVHHNMGGVGLLGSAVRSC